MPFFRNSEPEPIEIDGRALQCQICSTALFWRREAMLNTAIATFLDFDWANRSAVCYVCASCGYIHWFLPPE